MEGLPSKRSFLRLLANKTKKYLFEGLNKIEGEGLPSKRSFLCLLAKETKKYLFEGLKKIFRAVNEISSSCC